jgi:hypothetical protein
MGTTRRARAVEHARAAFVGFDPANAAPVRRGRVRGTRRQDAAAAGVLLAGDEPAAFPPAFAPESEVFAGSFFAGSFFAEPPSPPDDPDASAGAFSVLSAPDDSFARLSVR